MEAMESLRALWRDGPGRPAHFETTGREGLAGREGPEQRRFEEWVQRLGYGDEGRWCCPVEDTFGAGWRAGYADGVRAAVRLLRVAYDPPESSEALHAVRPANGGRKRDTL
jgi:hypothetical protein